jgi:phage shock protein C
MSGDVKRLYRSLDERMLAGVCGGLAEYFNMDPTLIRVLFVILSLAGGPGIVAYIILAIIVPEEPTSYTAPSGDQPQANVEVELDDELE